jgi:hypothetical protein
MLSPFYINKSAHLMRLCYPTISEEIRVSLPESFTSIEVCPFGAFAGLFPFDYFSILPL